MNERIQELALQARKALATDAMGGGKFDMQAYEEKLAELMIKECMEVSRPFYMGTPADSVYYVERAINRIAKYFGVE